MMNRLHDITDDYVLRRSNIENYKNGRVKIGCIIIADGFDIFGINNFF